MCCSPVSHLLCSPHQEWNSLWWISTKRFETYKERQFSQVCYLKPGNLGIQFTHRWSQGSLWCLSGRLESGLYIEIESFRAIQSMTDPILRLGLSYLVSLSIFLFFLLNACKRVWVYCNHGSGPVFPELHIQSRHHHSSSLILLAGPVKQHTLKDGVTLKCC